MSLWLKHERYSMVRLSFQRFAAVLLVALSGWSAKLYNLRLSSVCEIQYS